MSLRSIIRCSHCGAWIYGDLGRRICFACVFVGVARSKANRMENAIIAQTVQDRLEDEMFAACPSAVWLYPDRWTDVDPCKELMRLPPKEITPVDPVGCPKCGGDVARAPWTGDWVCQNLSCDYDERLMSGFPRRKMLYAKIGKITPRTDPVTPYDPTLIDTGFQ